MRWIGVFAACLLGAWTHSAKATLAVGDPQRALAPDANVSYSVWTVSGREVMLRFLLPVTESESVFGRLPSAIVTRSLGDYLLEHTAVAASGKDCPAEDQGYDIGRVDPLSVGSDLHGFEIFFRCPTAKGLALTDSALFDRRPGHVNFARIEIRGSFHEELFTSARRRLFLPDAGAPAVSGAAAYARLGARHVLQRVDLMCFVLGVALLFAEGAMLRGVALGLSAGYLSSGALALTDWVVPRDDMPGASVGLLVALLAGLYVVRGLRERSRATSVSLAMALLPACAAVILRRPDAALLLVSGALFCGSALAVQVGSTGRLALLSLVAFLLAMVDGFTLSRVLLPLDLQASVRLPMLAGFDTGALSTELGLMCLTVAARRVLENRVAKSGEPAAATLMRDVVAAALGCLGVFWLISRSLSG
ncbi:MAG TPA: hypothetical protein VGG96_12075 [Steroidobacteraceae bacterium]|jgi:hypothetical protein